MAVRRFRITSFAKKQNIIDISLKFQDACHIHWSAKVELSFGDKKLVFSGVLGRLGSPILRHPEKWMAQTGWCSKSTYDDKDHADIEELRGKLLEIVLETLDLGEKFWGPNKIELLS